jgi:hypothetical protein
MPESSTSLSRSIHGPIAAVWLACALSAQSTLNVGPGGYAEITDAIAAAQPGDLIVVQQGAYLPFDLSIGVRILAPDGATVTTPPGGGGLPWVHHIQPPAGQSAQLVGLSFRTNSAYPPAEPPVALSVTGNVVFADCTFYNWSDYASQAVTCNGDVQFDRCHWSSVNDGMSEVGGRVVANACVFEAFQTLWAGSTAGCIVANNGEVALNFCQLHGSDSISTSAPIGVRAIRLDGTARLTIADSVVEGGDSVTWASTAIVNNTALPVQHARSNIVGGHGRLSMVPPLSGSGPGFSGPEQTVALIGGAGATTGPRVGSSYYGSVVAPVGRIALMVLSFERTPAATVPFVAQPIHFDPTTATVYGFGLTSDFSPWPGTGAYIWQTVTLPTSMIGEQFWLHSLVWDGALFQVGPTFGGVAY